MRLQRFLVIASLTALATGSVAACASANPGWTYQPAPSITAAPSGEAAAEPSASADTGAVAITASGLAFEQSEVAAPSGGPFQIAFANNDAGTPHNVAIHRDGVTGTEVFKGEIFPGVETRTYDVPALDAGTYAFVCTVHPTMVGMLTAG